MKTLAPYSSMIADDFRRPPEVVMRLKRMGCFHQTRLSFMRVLLRRLEKENWRFKRTVWEIDEQGYGRAVYTVVGPERSYSLVAFSHELADHERSDRVIATAWDATFALFDGIPSTADLDRLQDNVPKQEAGRVSDAELSLSRANRSVRLWQHVIEHLAAGKQPDREQIEAVGYLIRTTAVYGSGKFGAADRLSISERPELKSPFQAEMLSVWLTRAFSVDLIEHIATARGGDHAVAIEPELRRRLGVGNSTGLGMAPFLINHPALLNNWMSAREEAIARVRSLNNAEKNAIEEFKQRFEQAAFNVSQWHSEHVIQAEKLEDLNADLVAVRDYIKTQNLSDNLPWNRLYLWSENNLSLEGQELLVSTILEPYGELIDDLSQHMHADEHLSFFIDGSMTVKELEDIVARRCGWATEPDYEQKSNRARFWYTSAEKLEPRVGERFDEPGAEYELPLGIGYYIKSMSMDLSDWQNEKTIADFLIVHPEHRHTVRRVQNLTRYPYAEIQDNLIAAEMRPIDLLRCKLAFFGATKFDPRSDRWVRICMYQDAPFPNELLDAAQ
jgi:hypothetical protein